MGGSETRKGFISVKQTLGQRTSISKTASEVLKTLRFV